jgi:N6-adenosine-specific RNA methylase IME4
MTDDPLESHPLANLFPLLDGAEFEALVEDIRTNGQREDIVLHEGKILDGRNRYRACVAAGVEPRAVAFRPDVDGAPLAYVVSRNLKRRHLNDDQRRIVAAKIANLGRGRRPDENAAECGISRVEAARLVNVDQPGTERARTVLANGVPALVSAVERGKLSVAQAALAARLDPAQQARVAAEAEAGRPNAARTVIKKAAREVRERELAGKIAAGNLDLPQQKFGVIVADPPWGRTVYSEATGMDRHAANHYPTATGDEATQDDAIRDLPVASIAADDCVLGLWCIEPWRGEAVLRAWGFKPVAYFVWIKDIVVSDPAENGMLRSGQTLEVVGAAGMGFWNRDRCEIMLIGTRGKPVCPAPGTQGERVWFARRGEHSTKPDCSLAWFERHWPTTPKVELNARRARPGWTVWGNEIARPEGERPIPQDEPRPALAGEQPIQQDGPRPAPEGEQPIQQDGPPPALPKGDVVVPFPALPHATFSPLGAEGLHAEADEAWQGKPAQPQEKPPAKPLCVTMSKQRAKRLAIENPILAFEWGCYKALTDVHGAGYVAELRKGKAKQSEYEAKRDAKQRERDAAKAAKKLN